MELYEVLKGMRKYAKISQVDFAKEMNFSQSYLSKLENNETSPTVETIVKYGKFFHISPAVLFYLTDSDNISVFKKQLQSFLFKKIALKLEPLDDEEEEN